MPLTNFQTRLLLTAPRVSAIGRLTMGGTIRNSQGVPRSSMRRLGAYAVVHLLSGGGRYSDAHGQDRAVSAGDVLVIFPELRHAYGPGPGQAWNEVYYVFDGPVFDAWHDAQLLDETRPVLHAGAIDYWYERWLEVARKTDALQAVCTLQQNLADLLELQTRGRTSEQDQAWLASATRRLKAIPPTDPIDWDALATDLGLSYAGFRKRFKRLSGRSPGEVVESRRLELATRLLATPGLVLKQIARDCGFCDEFHFSKRFKRHTGLTPRDYRRRTGM